MNRYALIGLLLVAVVANAQPGAPPKNGLAADPVPEPPKETIFALKLKAAGPPLPILRYELLPSYRDQSRNNAALLYHRALHLLYENQRPGKETGDARLKMDEILQKPLKDIPAEELRNYIKPFAGMFREVEAAAKCRDCDWGLGERISAEAYNLLLPELQKCRELAFLLKVRCRLHQIDGNLDAALRDIQTGLTMGRHVGRADTLISFLVGTAITAVTLTELDRVLEMPKCPNLYWSLTALPRPFISLDLAAEGELRGMDAIMPLPRDIEEPMTAEQARLALDTVWARIQKFTQETGASGFPKMGLNESRLGLAMYITMTFPAAKKSLIAAGKPEAEVNAMPAAQVVMLDSVLRYRNLRDEYMMWLTLPTEEAIRGMKKAEDDFKILRKNPTDYFVIMLSMLLPATQKVYDAQVRTQRRIASLRTVEAVRLHTAKHGKAPAKLEDITMVPVPADPASGKPFEYVMDEKSFTVIVPAPPGQTPNLGNAWKYQITWVK